MKHYILLSLLLLSATVIQADEKTLLQQAIDGSHRSKVHKNRDIYRHPKETLSFFEVKANMTVVEIWPGGKGWYTEILAPYLKESGKLYTAHFSVNSNVAYFTKNLQMFKLKIKAEPNIYSKVIVTALHPPEEINISPKGSADRVLTFRNIHNWMKNNQAETVFKAFYASLKQGGILGVIEHRGLEGSDQDPLAKSGYVKQSYVIALAEKAGFKFVDKSELNANAKDTTNYAKGVWTLPPSLRLKQLYKNKYLAIGESDRMTLKFIKP
ncbi:MAG: class I SAM-dependent methyltransferase [Methylococcales bacterium]|nr:class I SAM-dependent methyltransferase [Methylococcales bacterium]